MTSEIFESHWKMYLDHCVDNCSYKSTTKEFYINQWQNKSLILVEALERYRNYDYWVCSITASDEESSMASDASFGPISFLYLCKIDFE